MTQNINTVGELIEALKNIPPDVPIVNPDGYEGTDVNFYGHCVKFREWDKRAENPLIREVKAEIEKMLVEWDHVEPVLHVKDLVIFQLDGCAIELRKDGTWTFENTAGG